MALYGVMSRAWAQSPKTAMVHFIQFMRLAQALATSNKFGENHELESLIKLWKMVIEMALLVYFENQHARWLTSSSKLAHLREICNAIITLGQIIDLVLCVTNMDQFITRAFDIASYLNSSYCGQIDFEGFFQFPGLVPSNSFKPHSDEVEASLLYCYAMILKESLRSQF